ncbi:MAG: PEGA domain-containing protein [Burkholderiales bacterium]|jgi:class 3 adenylate cyclase|nr:PEGA domain-containing protein [Burkholderiales bacterium]
MSNGNRTFICSVVFIDIVEYSKKSVAEQLRVKEQFNALLARALADVPAKDRIILDTGDGAAISFLGDPEDALFLGLALRDALRGDDTLQLRTGINLGPVRLVRDINGQPNIIGDGINVAQRIMSFAGMNQVFVSRSYYEVVSALSPDYALLFAFEGSRTDKHVREHEVYALGNAPAPQRAPRRLPGAAAAHAAAALHRFIHAAHVSRAFVTRRPPLATALAVALILIAATGLRLLLKDMEAREKKRAELAEATVIMPRPLPAPPPAAGKPPAPVVEARPAAPPRPAKKPAPAEAEVATGSLRLAVLPWGEIFINGNKYGVSPPLRDIALKPGLYKVEVRNPGFASYLQVVEVRSGEEIRIRHRFR